MSKRVLLIRWGAFGDHIHMSNVIKAYNEMGYVVDMEFNDKGGQVHAYNPRINNKIYFETSSPEAKAAIEKDPRYLIKRIDNYSNQYDKVVSFAGSLEHSLIEPDHKSSYFWPLKLRRAKNTHTCYYDQSMKWAGLHDKEYMGWSGEIWSTRADHEHIQKQLEPYKDKFIILWAMRGSMWQKAVYPIAEKVCTEFLKRNPNTVIITTGDDFCQKWEWDGGENVIHKSGRMPFRQAMVMSKYVDLVVTPETGLGIAAGAYGTPKIMLLTAASLTNIVGNDANDYSLQSTAYCSPCTRAIYNVRHCPVTDMAHDYPDDPHLKSYSTDKEGIMLPICVQFDPEVVVERMQEVFNAGHPRQWEENDVRIANSIDGKVEVWI
jgi:ADP-heptose:LPS heptosyltransferase